MNTRFVTIIIVNKQSFEITWVSLWRISLFSLLVFTLYVARDIFAFLGLAIVFSSALDPFVSYLENKKIPRIIGTILAFIFALLVVIFLIYTIAPIFIYEFQGLFGDINRISAEIFGLGIPKNVLQQINFTFENALKFFTGSAGSFFTLAQNVFNNIVLFLASVIITFYLTFQKRGVESFLKVILPQNYEDPVVALFQRSKKKIGSWFRAQVFLGLIIGIIVSLTLLFLGVPYSLALGLVAGILEIFPVVGPILASIIAIFVALSQSAPLALYTLIAFVIIQQLENHILVPTIMSRIVGLNPIVVLISLLLGGKIGGLLGLILSVPTVVFLQEIVENFSRYKGKRLTV